MHVFFLFVVAVLVGQSEAQKSAKRKAIFRVISKNGGPSLYPHDIISNHTANSPTECSLRCLEKSTCVGFNYKTKSNRYVINCQVGSKTKEKNIKKNETKGEWTFYQDLIIKIIKNKKQKMGQVNIVPTEPQTTSTQGIKQRGSCKDILASNESATSGSYWIQITSTDPMQVYCDMETHGGGWTLVYSYTFTNYSNFGSAENSVTPRPSWEAKYAEIPISTTPPLNESTFGAVNWTSWKNIGDAFMVKSNINDWIVCKQDQQGSIVEKKNGGLSCENIKNVATACVEVPKKIWWWGPGPLIYLDKKAYYYFDGSRTRGIPTHDPCGQASPSNHKKGVVNPGGQIYLR